MGGASACDRRVNSRARKIIVPKDGIAGRVTLGFSERRWDEMQSKIPDKLSTEDSTRLRSLVSGCCDQFLTTAKLIQKGALAASSVKKGGGKQAAPLDQLERHLRSAAKILGAVEDMLDDRPGLLRRYRDQLETMAADVLARKEALRNLQPVVVNPKHELVRSLAKICESCGLKVTATNRI